MKKKRWGLAAVLCLSLTVGLAGCGQSTDGAGSASGNAIQNASGDAMGGEMSDDMPPGDMPAGDMQGGSQETVTTYRCTENEWSFQLIVTENGDELTKEAILTGWDTDVDSQTVIVPAVLGGAEVTTIESTALARANNVKAVFLPSTVKEIKEFAFYDLNGLEYISCANPQVEIEDGALASCNNQSIVTEGETVGSMPQEKDSIVIGGGEYLNTSSYELTQDQIDAIAIQCEGGYEPSALQEPVICEAGFTDPDGNQVDLKTSDFKYTFHDLTDDAALAAWEEGLETGAFSTVSKGLRQYENGYFLNGDKVELEENVEVYDAATGEELPEPLSTGGAYAYVAYRDFDNNGKIDALYYTDGSITAVLDQDASIVSDYEPLDGKDSASSLEGKYLAFANGVIEASGQEDSISYDSVDITDTKDVNYTADADTKQTNAVMAQANAERSILWADDYGTISIKALNACSTSSANWAKETFEAGDSSYNYEVNMQYGLNAGLYATNGGQIIVGSKEGERSYLSTNGDTGNGMIAIGGGSAVGTQDAPFASSAISVTNATIEAKGWNSHIADCIYGGFVYLEDVSGTTGIKGSYLGQSSALANDFGAGVIRAVDCDFVTYGNGSAGAYVIGENSGHITAENTNFTSYLDSGLCTAGGTFDITGGRVSGIIALRARASGASSTLKDVTLVKADVETNYSEYVTGSAAYEAAAAWQQATGDSGMPGPEMSNLIVGKDGATLGDLCDAYGISTEDRSTMYETLDQIAQTYGYTDGYSDETMWRTSLFDSDIYGHPVAGTGKLVNAQQEDYSSVPYMNNGVGAEGLQTSSVLEFQGAALDMNLENCKVEYEGATEDYNYLIASESGSTANVYFTDCKELCGIIWNQGSGVSQSGNGVNQSSQGTDTIDSAVNVTFDNSTFCGNFADGTNGLWEVEGLSYVNSNGENSSLNGNYYGNASNWGIQAVLQNASKWIVKNNSFIGTLTIDETSEITTEDGTPISIYTDVTDVMNLENPVEELAAGTYHNVVIVTDADSLVLESTPVTAMASGDASGDAKQVQTGGTMTIPIVLGILFVVSIICIFIIVTRKDESSQK